MPLVVRTIIFLLLSLAGGAKRRREKTEKHIKVKLQNSTVILGQRIKTGNDFIAGFTGIPYAESPVGPLRFAKPVKRQLRIGESIEATSIPPACLQNEYDPYPSFLSPQLTRSEDCLYLNVFTKHKWISKKKRKPVLFYIHGGSFSNGDGISRDGSGLVRFSDLVLVSVNYRLQMMGFMNYYEGIPMNLGLWDIIVALEWVQENIEVFGGDKDRVTIMGESAGGALVTYLHTSSYTQHLFQRSIALSGTLLAPWAFTDVRITEQQARWNIILGTTGCIREPEPLDCLRNVSSHLILDAMNATVQLDKYPLDTWAPVIDGVIITDTPANTLKNVTSPNRPLLSGTCQNEGSHIALALAGINNVSLLYNTDTIEDITTFRELSVNHRLVRNVTMPCMQDNGDAVVQMYTSKEEAELKVEYAGLIGDWLLSCPQFITASQMSDSGYPVYQYIFDYLSYNTVEKNQTWAGVQHNEDLGYILGLPLSSNSIFANRAYDKKFGAADKSMSRFMMRLVAEFVRSGVPVVQGRRGKVCWDSLEGGEKYLHVTNKKAVTMSFNETVAHCKKLMSIVATQTIPCI